MSTKQETLQTGERNLFAILTEVEDVTKSPREVFDIKARLKDLGRELLVAAQKEVAGYRRWAIRERKDWADGVSLNSFAAVDQDGVQSSSRELTVEKNGQVRAVCVDTDDLNGETITIDKLEITMSSDEKTLVSVKREEGRVLERGASTP